MAFAISMPDGRLIVLLKDNSDELREACGVLGIWGQGAKRGVREPICATSAYMPCSTGDMEGAGHVTSTERRMRLFCKGSHLVPMFLMRTILVELEVLQDWRVRLAGKEERHVVNTSSSFLVRSSHGSFHKRPKWISAS